MARERMNHDGIIREVRAIREQIAARAGYSIRRLCEEARRQQREGDRPIMRLKPRPLPQGQGTTRVAVTIRNPADPGRNWEAVFRVDTGATDCVVPRPALEGIGLTPRGQRVYELAEGREMKVDVTVAELEFMGEIVGGTIIYGDSDTEPLLGIAALESAGVIVDPTSRTLKKLPAVRLKTWQRPPGTTKRHPTTSDQIIEELWQIKDDIAREHGHDIGRLVAYFRRRRRRPGERVIDLSGQGRDTESESQHRPKP